MNRSVVVSFRERCRPVNAVRLENAVLCAECDVVSDSPHDTCLVCGSRSLFNVARVLGGCLPQERANLLKQAVDAPPGQILLVLPKPHRAEEKKAGSRRRSSRLASHRTDQPDRSVLIERSSN